MFNHYSPVVTILTFLVTLCNSALCAYSALRWFRIILTPNNGYFFQQHEPFGVYNEDTVFPVRQELKIFRLLAVDIRVWFRASPCWPLVDKVTLVQSFLRLRLFPSVTITPATLHNHSILNITIFRRTSGRSPWKLRTKEYFSSVSGSIGKKK